LWPTGLLRQVLARAAACVAILAGCQSALAAPAQGELAPQSATVLPLGSVERVLPLSSARPVPPSWGRSEVLLSAGGKAHAGVHFTQSTNWSGYVDSGGGASFTEVSGAWTVPEVRPGPAGYSSSWVGIDGTTSQDLIQAGTEQDWGPQGVVYYAWYELLPAASMYLGPVYPGDQMSVEIKKAGAASWTISVYDATQRSLWTGAVSYVAPGASAEWVEEAPTNSQNSQLYPLADFGAVSFSALGVGGPSTGRATVSPVYMVTATSGKVEAYPARYSRATDSFGVTFGAPPLGSEVDWPAVALGRARPAPAGSGGATASPAPGNARLETGFPRSPRALGAANPLQAPAASPPSPVPGYWLAAGDGGVFAFGRARYAGSAAAVFAGSHSPGVTGIAGAPGGGYWLVTASGGVFPFGGAPYLGSVSSLNLSAGDTPAIAASPSGAGYYILSPWGDVFAFGDARFEGSCGRSLCGGSGAGKGESRAGPSRAGGPRAVALVPDATGKGYWLVLSDCKVASFGDARPLTSQACQRAAEGSAVAAAGRSPDGGGFWALLSNGALFPLGSAAGYGRWYRNGRLNAEGAVALLPTGDGKGAWVVRSDGSVEPLGDATPLGDLPAGLELNQAVTSAAGA